MSSNELRKAAETLREKAKASSAVSPAPWSGGEPRDCHCCDGPPLVDANGAAIVDAWQMERADAEYVKAAHPGVGLALADWLDAMGAVWDGGGKHVFGRAERKVQEIFDRSDIDPTSLMGRALNLARLINGGAA